MTPNISNTNTDFSPRISLKCVRDNDEHTRPRSELNVVFMLSSRWVGVFRHMSPFIRNDFDVLESNVTRSARLRRQWETTLSRFLPDHVERWHAFVMKHQDSISDLRNPTDPTGGQTGPSIQHRLKDTINVTYVTNTTLILSLTVMKVTLCSAPSFKLTHSNTRCWNN